MEDKPKHPLNGLGSKFHFVDKATWSKIPQEHRSVKKMRGLGGWYETKYIISPEAFDKISQKPISDKSAESNTKK